MFKLRPRLLVLLAISLIILSIGRDSFNLTKVGDLASPYIFSILRWEVENFPDKWLYKAKNRFTDRAANQYAISEDFKGYFLLVQSRDRIVHNIWQFSIYSDSDPEDLALLRKELITIENAISEMRPFVEQTIESHIKNIAMSEELNDTWILSALNVQFPPVDIRMENSPKLLVISPRNHIEVQQTILLDANMDTGQILALEKAVYEDLNLSALVVNIGGVATYPAIVPINPDMEQVLIAAAHEWLHHYLFFKPLGRKYWSDRELTSVNETLCNMFGAEVGTRIYEEFMGDNFDVHQGSSLENLGSNFDFRREMRRIRIKIEEILKEGNIELAESRMVEERKFLEENGYYVRKLNQAYFAFNGTYADHPSSISPIAGQLTQIRENSDSLGDFVRKVSRVSSHEEFLKLWEINLKRIEN